MPAPHAEALLGGPAPAAEAAVVKMPPLHVGGGAVMPQRPDTAAQVISYVEQAYTLRDGDTYEKISEQFYQSKDYADALRKFNRDHPRQTNDRIRAGLLVPNETIYLPSLQLLETRYLTKPKPASPAQEVIPTIHTPKSGADPR